MNSQKKIEVNLSSLLGLKAELERKKREVDLAKSWSGANRVKPRVKIKNKCEKSKKDVEDKNRKDVEDKDEDLALLRKSRTVLEAKSKIYDSLTQSRALGESTVDTSEFLVNFEQKQEESFTVSKDSIDENVNEEKAESSHEDFEYDSEEEWIDFIDCLGRSKRCHKDDFPAMKKEDEKLKTKLFGEPEETKIEKKEQEQEEFLSRAATPLPELCSEDMKKDIMRQKWEEQERILLDKKDIHYQDVLFHEARSHGVGYYEFSTDEAERFRQQQELKRTREETLMRQASSKEAAERKKKQALERSKAAKRRKRERLGLEPEEDEPENEPNIQDIDLAEENAGSSEKVKLLQRESDPRKDSTVRPWDVGKEGVSKKVLSQEEWIEKKRSERPREFAPPCESKPWQKNKFQRKESYFASSTRPVETEKQKTGACVPPPSTYHRTSFGGAPSVAPDVEKSIEEGLKFLRKQVEEKQSHTKKGIFDFL